MSTKNTKDIILGAGITGLGAALSSHLPVYEGASRPGGVCHSYYLDQDDNLRDPYVDDVSQCFRFEPAGGHWLFGVNETSLKQFEDFCTFSKYLRTASVFFPRSGGFLPYPLQDNLRHLDEALRCRIVEEICSARTDRGKEIASFKDWLLASFRPNSLRVVLLSIQ